MRLTTRGRYAVTAVLDLALHGDDGPVTLADVAERQGISQENEIRDTHSEIRDTHQRGTPTEVTSTIFGTPTIFAIFGTPIPINADPRYGPRLDRNICMLHTWGRLS